jgi:DnaA-homolog protein
MAPASDALTPQLPLGFSLAPGATFASYFTGSNGLAVDLLQAMGRGGGERQVFLAGAQGLGKTHLLQAACRERGDAGGAVAYLPLADVGTLEPAAVEGLEHLALIAVDDIDAVAGDGAWERALFGLINAVRSTGARLVLAARGVPSELPVGLADLASRLAWGPVVRLAPLDDDAKCRALAARAGELGLELPPAVGEYLVRRHKRDLAALLARLDELDRASLATGRRLTIPFVREVLTAAEAVPPAGD